MIKKASATTTVEPSALDIFEAVLDERAAQDAQWGGIDHDDKHSMRDWCGYLTKQIEKVSRISSFTVANGEEFEQRMTKVAALAFAAIQSNRRRLNKFHGVA